MALHKQRMISSLSNLLIVSNHIRPTVNNRVSDEQREIWQQPQKACSFSLTQTVFHQDWETKIREYSLRCEEMIARWHSGESSHPDREVLAAECPETRT